VQISAAKTSSKTEQFCLGNLGPGKNLGTSFPWNSFSSALSLFSGAWIFSEIKISTIASQKVPYF